MLRTAVLSELRSKLHLPPFLVADDFTFETKAEKDSVLLTVRYFGTAIAFVARIPNQKTKKDDFERDFAINCGVNPGEITTSEQFQVWGLSKLTSAFASWAERVANDFEREPAMRLAAQTAERLAEVEQQLNKVSNDQAATPEQIAKVQEWLTNLENDMRDKFEALTLDAQEKKARLEALTKEFTFLRQRVESGPIKSTLRAISVRLHHVATDPQTGALLQNGVNIAQLTGLIK